MRGSPATRDYDDRDERPIVRVETGFRCELCDVMMIVTTSLRQTDDPYHFRARMTDAVECPSCAATATIQEDGEYGVVVFNRGSQA